MEELEFSIIKEFFTYIAPFITIILGYYAKQWVLRLKARKCSLLNHSLLTSLSNSIRDVKLWQVTANRQVFVDALRIKLECWQERAEELAIELNKKGKLTNGKLYSIITNWTNDVIDEYNKKWIENNIPKPIINRINKNHKNKTDEFVSEIQAKSYNNDMYPLTKYKTVAILDTLKTLLAETKSDFYQLVYREKYNGAFKGCKYKGIPINDDEFEKYLKKNKK